jgi:hypothetical protein
LRRLLLLVTPLVLVAATAAAPAAPGDVPVGTGRTCAFHSVGDPAAPGWQVGEVEGGPLTGTGTLVCTIVRNANWHLATGTSVAASGDGVIVLPPTPVRYAGDGGDDVALCTRLVTATGTLYWTAGPEPYGGTWSTDPRSPCGLLFVPPPDPGSDVACRTWKTVDLVAGTDLAERWQDCEPYDPLG